MNYKEFAYLLLTEDGRSFVIKNGVVTTQVLPDSLPQTPDGWQDILISWERDLTKLGTVRTFSFPLGFVLDGAKIIRSNFYSELPRIKMFLMITQFDPQIDDTYFYPVYKKLYKGLLDFSTCKDKDEKVTISINEAGIYKQVKANENTVYEFPLNDPECITVKMDGIILEGNYKWTLIEDSRVSGQNVRGMVLNGEEQKAPGIIALDVLGGGEFDPNALTVDNTEYFLVFQEAPYGDTGRFYGTIKLSNPLTSFPANQYLKIFNTVTGTTRDTIQLSTGNEQSEIEFDITVSIQKGDRFFLQIDEPILQSEVYFSASSRNPATFIQAYKPSTLGKKLAAKITGSESNFSSTLIEANDNLVLTSGDGMRSLSNAVLKTKLSDYSTHHRVVLGAREGIENNKIVFEEVDHFFDTSNPIHTGNATDFEISDANDLKFNTLKIGYQPKNINDLNGKKSFNNTSVYTTPEPDVVKEYPLISPCISDPYLQEITRINLDGKTTTDNEADNEVMVINVEEVAVSYTIPTLGAGVVLGANLLQVSGADALLDELGVGQKITISGAPINNQTYTINSLTGIGEIAPGVTGFIIGLIESLTVGDMSGATIGFSYYIPKRIEYDTIEGIPEVAQNTIYNIEQLTPARLMKVHEKWFNSCHHRYAGQKITFQSTDKNRELKTVKDGVTYDEDRDVVIGTEKYFKPFYFEYATEVPTDLNAEQDENPNNSFETTWEETDYKGIMFKAGFAPNTKKEQVFKILCASDQDVSKLIK